MRFERVAGVAALLGGWFLLAAPANATGFCSCCIESPAEACAAACASMTKVAGECPAFVIHDGTGEPGKDGNPLNGMSLKDLSIGDPDSRQLENFRRFLERYRSLADRRYGQVVHDFNEGKATEADLKAARALFDEAIVNYQHGIRAYLIKIGKKPT